MFGMMPWGGAAGGASSAGSVLCHFDGNLTNSVSGGPIVSASGTVAYTSSPAKFSQALKWSSAGSLSTPVITNANASNGVMMECWARFSGSGDITTVVSLQTSGGTTQVGFQYNPGSGANIRIIYNAGSTYTSSTTSNTFHHIVLALYRRSGATYSRWAIDGVWFAEDNSDGVSLTDLKFVGCADPVGGLDRHHYDELRITLGQGSFPYTTGTNFTPPTSPYTV